MKKEIPFEALDNHMNIYAKLLDTLEQLGSAKVIIDYAKAIVTIEPDPTIQLEGEGAIRIWRQPRLIEIKFFGKYNAYIVTRLIKAYVLSEKVGLMTLALELIDAVEYEIYCRL
ncbi:MAG: hypothetical protein JHC26_10725 [Thermofilum sp.]|uniref:hypothetical protein n=1 Tax=Thermofilum sp. TaxID=1961369 RepID=UPI002590FFA5|nr:hypothetical protein [Thermofilum sp.]MCI4409555.1 hypothetical protein [Thermofilum sp.]